MIQEFFQAHSQRIERLACSRHPFDYDQRRLVRRLHQCFLQEILACISRRNAIRRALPVLQFTDHTAGHPTELRLFLRLIGSEQHKLVFLQFRHIASSVRIRHICLIRRHPFLLKIFKKFFRHIQFTSAAVLILTLKHLIRGKILCTDAEDLCLDPQQQILGHQNDLFLVCFIQPQADTQNPVIRRYIRQVFRKGDTNIILLYTDSAAVFKRHSADQVPAEPQLLKTTYHPAGIGADLSLRFFKLVQFFQNDHRKYNLIVLKALQCVRRLEKDIRINYINLYHTVSFRCAGISPGYYAVYCITWNRQIGC